MDLGLHQQSSSLQGQAIERARDAISRLPSGDAIFQQCVDDATTITDVLELITQKYQSHKKKSSTQLLDKFQTQSLWLQNISSAVDVAVQTQAGIGCPLWLSDNWRIVRQHFARSRNSITEAAEHILSMIETISENLPRYEIYERLQPDHLLQIALLDIFTDVVEFAVRAQQYLGRRSLVRLGKLVARSFGEEFKDILDRLERHAKIVDRTAVAIGLQRAAEFRRENKTKDVEKWLRPSKIGNIHQTLLETKLPGTCGWIWTNPTFQAWRAQSSSTPPTRILWIYGTHGCGKTILASSIVAALKSQQQKTLLFSFSGTDFCRQDLDCLIRALLWQLLQEIPDERNLKIVHDLMVKGAPLASELWDAFIKVGNLAAVSVCCVIDGVDECNDPAQKLFRNILDLVERCPSFRAILLGRPHVFQHVTSPITYKIEITFKLISQDIDAFINAEIDKSETLKLLDLRNSIFSILQKHSDGMFLWVKLMIDDLRKSATVSEVRERLMKVPRGLEETYRHLFLRLTERLDSFELGLARRVLAFVSVSCRPLMIDELNRALALDSRSSSKYEKHPPEEYLLLQPAQTILQVCGDVITITNNVVQLNHFSVKEFLTRSEENWLSDGERKIVDFRVDLEYSNRTFGSICVDYLGMCQYGSTLRDPSMFQGLGSRFPFLEYASLYVVYHLNRSGSHCSMIMDKVMEFLESEKCLPWFEYLLTLMLDDEFIDSGAELKRLASRLEGAEQRKLSEAKLLLRMQQELVHRTQLLGENDPATERWRMIVDLAEDLYPLPDTATIHGVLSVPSRETPPGVSHVTALLNRNTMLPLSNQFDVLLRLQSYLRKVTIITDPLKALLGMILQKAQVIPVSVILVIGRFYERLRNFEEAQKVYRTALAKIGNKETPTRFSTLRALGYVCNELGQYEQAMISFTDALTGQEKILDRDHEEILFTMHWIGIIHNNLDQYEEALKWFKRAFAGRQRTLGVDNEYSLSTMHWMGIIYHGMERYEEALECFNVALVGREKVLGTENEDTLSTVLWIGVLHNYLESYKKASEWLQKALTGREKLLGAENEHTLSVMHWIGIVHDNIESNEDALEWFQKALEGRKKVLGIYHEDTLLTIHWIGIMHDSLGHYEEALEWLQEALAGRIEEADDEDTLSTIHWLGVVNSRLGNYEEALNWFRKALTGRERTLKADSQDTLSTVHWMGVIHDKLGLYEEALEWLKKALRGRKRTLGINHEDTVLTMHQMGIVYCHLR